MSLDRRQLLRGAGVAVGLPFLEAMTGGGRRAAAATPKRILFVFTANGMALDRWRPTGSETDFKLGPTLAALEPYKRKLMLLDGIFLKNAGGDGHTGGMGAALTGRPLLGSSDGISGWASGISVDQALAKEIGKQTKLASLELAAGKTHRTVWGRTSYLGSAQPVPPEESPANAWKRLFSTAPAGQPDTAALARRAQRKSVMDAVLGDYDRLLRTLGAADKQRLDAHVTALRGIEARIDAMSPAAATCQPPGAPAATEDYPRLVELQTQIAVAALACGLTNVATLQWQNAADDRNFAFAGANTGHHGAAHRKDAPAIAAINKWFGDRFAKLLESMDATPDGNGKTLLDNTAVLWFSEMSDGYTHFHDNAPFLLAGLTGHFKSGRWVRYTNKPNHNDLLVSLLNAMDVPAKTFGEPGWCSGPLPRLT